MHWCSTLGLQEDLLPVVCKPGCQIASGSKLKSYGKVPSLYTVRKEVSGISQWTSKRASADEVRAWCDQPDYGICLQTRRMRAIDCDITDPALAQQVLKTLQDGLFQYYLGTGDHPGFPIRVRRDSSKFLLLFEMDGDYGKRIITTHAGIIEFLANGQQCLVAGTHKDGARYEWLAKDGALPTRLVLSEQQFLDTWDTLALCYATEEPTESRVRKPRPHADGRGAPAPYDPVVVLLHAKGVVLGSDPDGRTHFTCPWKADHSRDGDVTETTYFPAGTGGYDRGHFMCLHAHCESRSDADFLDALGWALEGFEVIDSDGEKRVAVRAGVVPDDAVDSLRALGIDEADDLIGAAPAVDGPPPLAIAPGHYHLSTGIIHPTVINVTAALDRPDLTGVHLVHDTFHDTVLIGPQDHMRVLKESDFTKLGLLLVRQYKFDAKLRYPTIREAALNVADDHSFDAALVWAASLPEWDGVSRVARFYPEYLGSEDSAFAYALGRYQWSAQAGRLLVPGIKADMVPVWVSAQGTGKTSAVRALVGIPEHYVEINLADDKKDLARSMRGKLIGELAELRGLKGREMEHTKAFITRTHEQWTPKFKEYDTTFPRRLLFIGTSNHGDFLADQTGNRRWLPIRLGQQNVPKIVQDRLQLWAEGISLFREHGILWVHAEALARTEHEDFEAVDTWEEPILKWLHDVDLSGVAPINKPSITTWDVLREALHFESRQTGGVPAQRVAGVLRRAGFEEKMVRIRGKRFRAWTLEVI